MASSTSDAPKGRSGIQHLANEAVNSQNGFYHREGKTLRNDLPPSACRATPLAGAQRR